MQLIAQICLPTAQLGKEWHKLIDNFYVRTSKKIIEILFLSTLNCRVLIILFNNAKSGAN